MLEYLFSAGMIASLIFTCLAIWMATQATRRFDFSRDRRWITAASHGWAVGALLVGILFAKSVGGWFFVGVAVAVGYLVARSIRRDTDEKERLSRFEADMSEKRKRNMPEG